MFGISSSNTNRAVQPQKMAKRLKKFGFKKKRNAAIHEVVRDWPVPRNVTDLRSFLELSSYMRKFIAGFSSVCKPLHVLTQKDQKFVWNDQAKAAFEKLKVALTTAPVFGFTQESKGMFTVDADCDRPGPHIGTRRTRESHKLL